MRLHQPTMGSSKSAWAATDATTEGGWLPDVPGHMDLPRGFGVGSVIYQGQNFGSYVSVVNHTPQSVHDVKLTVEVEQSSPHPVLLPLRERREGVADVQASRDTLLVRKVSMLPSGASMDLVSDTVLVAAAESACVPQDSVLRVFVEYVLESPLDPTVSPRRRGLQQPQRQSRSLRKSFKFTARPPLCGGVECDPHPDGQLVGAWFQNATKWPLSLVAASFVHSTLGALPADQLSLLSPVTEDLVGEEPAGVVLEPDEAVVLRACIPYHCTAAARGGPREQSVAVRVQWSGSLGESALWSSPPARWTTPARSATSARAAGALSCRVRWELPGSWTLGQPLDARIGVAVEGMGEDAPQRKVAVVTAFRPSEGALVVMTATPLRISLQENPDRAGVWEGRTTVQLVPVDSGAQTAPSPMVGLERGQGRLVGIPMLSNEEKVWVNASSDPA